MPDDNGAQVYYSDDDNCECGWELPGHVIAVSADSELIVVCPECATEAVFSIED